MEREDRPPQRHRRVPDPERDHVHGQEAARPGLVGDAVGQRGGRDRRDRGDRREVAREQREHACGDEPERDADHQADPELPDDEHDEVVRAVGGLRDPRDQAERQRDGRRVVRARLRAQERGEPPAQRREAQRGEDGGGVGRADHRAEEERGRGGEVEQRVGRRARDRGGHGHAEGAEETGRCEHRADVAPVRREPALEQDREEPDHADGAGQLRVVEVDPADALRAEQHSEPEEGDEQGEPEAARRHGGDDR